MKDGQTFESGKEIANELMKKLEIEESDLIPVAYIDMLLDPSYQDKYGHASVPESEVPSA